MPSDPDRKYLQADRPRWSGHSINLPHANKKGYNFLIKADADKPWEEAAQKKPAAKTASKPATKKKEEVIEITTEESEEEEDEESESEEEQEEGGKRKLLKRVEELEKEVKRLKECEVKYKRIQDVVQGGASGVPGVPTRKEIKKGTTICQICKQDCKTTTKLRKHNDFWHLNTGKNKCTICQKVLQTKKNPV